MIHESGANHDMELPCFLGCTEDGLFTAALADGFVSAMTQLIFGLRNYSWLFKIDPAILLKNVLK
jgi:hypothetical protein